MPDSEQTSAGPHDSASVSSSAEETEEEAEEAEEEDAEDAVAGDVRSPTNAAEAAQFLYETASCLQRAQPAHYERGVSQLLALVDQVIAGQTSVTAACAVGRAWLAKDSCLLHVDSLCGSAAAAARRLSKNPDSADVTGAAIVAPCAAHDTLWFHSASSWKFCSGKYKLVADTEANGMPLWHKAATDDARGTYIYSTPSEPKRWRVTDDRADFSQGGGYFVGASPHNGTHPHLTATWCKKGQRDNGVVVTSPVPGRTIVFRDEDGDCIEMFLASLADAGDVPLLQYAVEGNPRLPTACIEYDASEAALVFPALACAPSPGCDEEGCEPTAGQLSVTLVPHVAPRVVRSLSLLLSDASGVKARLPQEAAQVFLAAWNVVGSNGSGRAYFYNTSSREATWDLCRALEAFSAEDGALALPCVGS